MMKTFLIIGALLFGFTDLHAQKVIFEKNKENATYEFHKFNTKIVKAVFKTQNGSVISSDLKSLILELLEAKKGFISVEFIDDHNLILEYQENLTDELVLKNINRLGQFFDKSFLEYINIDKK